MPVRHSTRAFILIDDVLKIEMHCLRIMMSAGGDRVNTAIFEMAGTDLNDNGKFDPVVNAPQAFKYETPSFALIDHFDNLRVTIEADVEPGPNDGGERPLIHIGRIVGGECVILPDSIRFISRFDEHMVSKAIDKTFYHSGEDKELETDMPLVFNPVFDGVPYGNKSTRDNQPPDGNDPDNNKLYFWHPDEPKDTDEPELWTLKNAILYLLHGYCDEEEFVFPDETELETMLGTDPPVPFDIKIKRGEFIFSALRHLLEPYGYSFAFFPIRDSGDAKHELKIWERNRGVEKVADDRIYLTAPGEPESKSTILGGKIDVDLVDSSGTKIIVLGDPVRKQGTFELIPGWDESKEDSDIGKFTKGSVQWKTDPALARVWRDYVLNEADEYDDFDYTAEGITPFDADTFFGTTQLKRRRRFYPTLSLGSDKKPIGRHQGIEVEYKVGTEWKPLAMSIQILPHECGVRIDTNKIPTNMMRQHKVRVTATIESDELFRKDGDELNNKLAVNSTKEIVIETKSKYKKYQIDPASEFASLPDSNAINHTTQIEELTTRLSKQYQKARFAGVFEIHAGKWDSCKLIGQRIEKIDGRGVDLRVDEETVATDKSYSVITGIEMDFQNQRQNLFLESFAG